MICKKRNILRMVKEFYFILQPSYAIVSPIIDIVHEEYCKKRR